MGAGHWGPKEQPGNGSPFCCSLSRHCSEKFIDVGHWTFPVFPKEGMAGV